jgi:hypothetical protein
MLVKPSFDDIQDDVGPGTYKGRIKAAKLGEWQTGTPYINWEIETYGESDAKNNGRRIFHKTATSGKGAFQLQKLYRAATGQVLKGDFDTDQLLGKEVEVELVDGINRQTGSPSGYVEVKSVRSVVGN